MKVLFTSHTDELGGGEHSLLGMLDALGDRIEPVVAAPPGPLAEALRARGVTFVAVPAMHGSFALHPLRTPRAVLDVVRAGVALRRAAARVHPDVVHANSVRAGLAALVATRLGGPPAVVHVRDVLPDGKTSLAIRRLIGRGASAVIANSAYTAGRFKTTKPVAVVYPSVDVAL